MSTDPAVSGDEPRHISTSQGGYASFDGMSWATPSADFGYQLRYGHEELSKSDRLYLASVVDCYLAIVHHKTIKSRNTVIASIKAGTKLRREA